MTTMNKENTRHIKTMQDVQFVLDHRLDVKNHRRSSMNHVEFMRLSLISILNLIEHGWWSYEVPEGMTSPPQTREELIEMALEIANSQYLKNYTYEEAMADKLTCGAMWGIRKAWEMVHGELPSTK